MTLQPDLFDFFKHVSKGELIFNSFEQAFKFVRYPTNYEQLHNISVEETKIIIDKPDIKLVTRLASDGTKALFIFFKNSTVYDVWKFWCPSKTQFDFIIKDLPDYVEKIDNQRKGD